MQPTEQTVQVGSFTRQEAVALISKGFRHVHSTKLADRDPLVKAHGASKSSPSLVSFSWEAQGQMATMQCSSSRERATVIESICKHLKLDTKRYLKEKATSILEELLSNAFYHAYRIGLGEEKYNRRSSVTLMSNETLKVDFSSNNDGIFLRVSDQAGTLDFNTVAKALRRCYETEAQIEAKESGAGLGTYMVFDAATHLRIDVTPGKHTIVSCWVADQKAFDPNNFSFNFFERRK
jgi:anti-sigma regulatory factor (Ser/Thr protein kinase)